MTSFCQWTLVWSVQMQSLLSSCILHISADNRHPSASSCQHNTDSTFLTGRGEKLWQAPFPHSFIRLHIRQTANHSLTLCRFLPHTHFQIYLLISSSRSRSNQKYFTDDVIPLCLFITNEIWSVQNINVM